MPNTTQNTASLVSVIIPCYNHGQYLPEAVNSIWQQYYPATEIIIIDDGSTDNTKEIVKNLPDVTYIYQTNQGLSAARNMGIKISHGEYLVFLDADDWLLPESIRTNISYLHQNKSLAFVSGAHEKVFVATGETVDEILEIKENHYCHLLQGNYIGMHATVMYRRSVFNDFLFDVKLNACEDYDLYLKITRKYPVLHHTQKIAAYRIHGSNMSGNIPMMLSMVLTVLNRQKRNLHTTIEKAAFKKGHKIWKEYYCQLLYKRLLLNKSTVTKNDLLTLCKFQPTLFLKYIIKSRL